MLKTFRQIAAVGIATEPPPRPDQALRLREALQARILAVLGRALCIRAVDAGSCNGCEPRFTRSTTRSTTSRDSAFGLSRARGTPTCCS